LERLLKDLKYKYLRKRAKDAKAARHNITMRNLALYFLVCKRRLPHEGVAAQVEEIFKEEKKYNEVFPESLIGKEPTSSNHIALQYILTWVLSYALDELKKELPKRDQQYFSYTSFFVMADLYERVLEWKTLKFNSSTPAAWRDLIESPAFRNALRPYVKASFKVIWSLLPKNEEARKFLRKKEATSRFFDKRPKSTLLTAPLSKAFK
jgi:hypothetical protein